MCAPAVIAMAAQTAIQMKAQKEQADYQAKVDENNAVLATRQANDAIQRGAYEARRMEIAGRRASASAAVAVEANGLSSTSGTMANLVDQSRLNAAADADTIRANAAREAWGYKNETDELRERARQTRRAGFLGALGTGIAGAGSAASSYASYRQANKGGK
jgi:hypothetical protein